MSRTRVAIVDDQALVRAGPARILGPEDGFKIVGEYGDGAAALAGIDADPPDLVLMDVRMPRMGGVEAIRALHARPDPPPVLVLTTFDDDDSLWATLDAGASGFVLKDASAADLIAAARTVAAGGSWLDPAVAPRVLAASRRAAPRAGRRLERLTDREHDVLRQIARGATNAEIARALHLSEATVKTHVRAIFTKLDARDRAAAIVIAHDHGIVGPAG
ncbi:response regulator [Pseudonocardia sp. GCM10023141]|uniref:response regulator transcription factor n=1 Tax=Pseudonocardia sp. GCM10023141 TaxID=3252653 RepID=UPI00361628FC